MTTEMCKAVNSPLLIAAEESHMENKQPGLVFHTPQQLSSQDPFEDFNKKETFCYMTSCYVTDATTKHRAIKVCANCSS